MTRAGRGLYALAAVKGSVPELVLVTLAELAEHGLASMTNVLPVPTPVSTTPRLLPQDQATIAELIGDARPAVPSMVVQLAESVRDRREHDHSTQREDWFCMNLTSYMGERMGSVLRRLLDAEARVAELEAERHTTNEALDDAVQELRARRGPDADRSADKLQRILAPSPAGEHEVYVHHSYRTGRDLPEAGGA